MGVESGTRPRRIRHYFARYKEGSRAVGARARRGAQRDHCAVSGGTHETSSTGMYEKEKKETFITCDEKLGCHYY